MLKHSSTDIALAHRAVPAPVASSSFPPAGQLPHLGVRPTEGVRPARGAQLSALLGFQRFRTPEKFPPAGSNIVIVALEAAKEGPMPSERCHVPPHQMASRKMLEGLWPA